MISFRNAMQLYFLSLCVFQSVFLGGSAKTLWLLLKAKESFSKFCVNCLLMYYFVYCTNSALKMLKEPVNAHAHWWPSACLKCVCGLRILEIFLYFLRCILVFDGWMVVVIDACSWKTVTSEIPKQQLKVATWNILGLSKVEKRQEVEEYLHNKKIDICAIQETKTNFEEMQTIGEYDLIFLGNKNLGMGFIVKTILIRKL